MKGDFTRDTFDPANHFRRVLMQQGRVQLDADWNEQAAILLHYLQTLAADLIGPHGGPVEFSGFKIDAATDTDENEIRHDFAIGQGRYYVDGILCENDRVGLTYKSQTDFPVSRTAELNGRYLIYLDVWERHLTYLEQEDPDGNVVSIREVALNGPDTASRAKVVWQVKMEVVDNQTTCESAWDGLVKTWQPQERGQLRAGARVDSTADNNPCVTPPESQYRGAENQLYRVEIHKGGTVAGGATFKWSRENGSVIFPIRSWIGVDQVELENLGRDARLGLQEGDWLEIVDDDYTLLMNLAGELRQVTSIDRDRSVVTLMSASTATVSTVGQYPAKHPLVRRWEGEAPIMETGTGDPNDDWINLENGVQVQFQKSTETDSKGNTVPNCYRTGDYWLIPARTATGDVEWPGTKDAPKPREPHGVTHHYAPLAIIEVTDGLLTVQTPDCRRKIKTLWETSGV